MVKVTDKNYYLDGFTQQIGDSICDRVQKRKQDILVIFDGAEGSGKTNASIALGYYVGWKTGRGFTNDNIFFDLDEMIKFAGSTKEKVILWDESALGGLSSDWTNASQKKLKAMLMVCRKLRHVFLFNIPRFYRLNSDIIERALCLFHIYENDKEEPGNFMFISRDFLQTLYQSWRTTKYANYWKYKKLHGCFLWVLPELIDEQRYEDAKDMAILKLANAESNAREEHNEQKLSSKLRIIYNNLRNKGLKNNEIAEIMNVDRKTLYEYRKLWGGGEELDKTCSKGGFVVEGEEDEE